MSEENDRQPIGSVSFSHRLNRGDTSVLVKLEFQQTGDVKTDAKLAEDNVFAAKAIVFQELGVEFETNEAGVLVPKGGWGVVARTPEAKTATDVASLTRPSHIPDWLWADLQANPSNYYDNRADKASGKVPASRPDFKSKDGKRTIYLTPKES